MRERKKLFATLVVMFVFCITQMFSLCAMAADNSAVKKVKIGVTNSNGKVLFWSKEPELYTVTSPAGETTFEIGESYVEMDVVIHTTEGHYFNNLKKSSVTFKDDSSGVTCQSISASENEAKLEVRIRYISGKLSAPDSAWWDEDDFGRACWDEVDSDAVTGYIIVINGNEIETDRTDSKDLRSYLNWGSTNHFKVKAISSRIGIKDSSFVKSDGLDLTRDSDNWDDHYNHRNDSNSYRNSGWISFQGQWYYIEANGQMLRDNWLTDRGKTYWLDSNGIMATGWKKIGWAWYYFGADGHMFKNTSIKSANGQFDYYLNSSGEMQTNRWQKNAWGWYYIGDDEPLRNCERWIDGETYRFDANGYMVVGWWREADGSYYYYYSGGAKAHDTIIVWNGNKYRLDSNGKWY